MVVRQRHASDDCHSGCGSEPASSRPHTPHLSRLASAGRGPAARDRDAGLDVLGAGDVHDRRAAAGPRHCRQRLVLSRSPGSLAVAAIEPAGCGRENLGGGETARSRLHHRQPVLVVQHGRQPRFRRDAASDLQGGWTQAAGLLHQAVGAAGGTDPRTRSVSAVPILGTGNVDCFLALDRRCGAAGSTQSIARRSRSSICRTWTTTCSASVPTTRALPRVSAGNRRRCR